MSFSNVVGEARKCLLVPVKMRKTLYRTASQRKAALTTIPDLSTPIQYKDIEQQQYNSDHNQLVSLSAVEGGHVDLPLTPRKERERGDLFTMTVRKC